MAPALAELGHEMSDSQISDILPYIGQRCKSKSILAIANWPHMGKFDLESDPKENRASSSRNNCFTKFKYRWQLGWVHNHYLYEIATNSALWSFLCNSTGNFMLALVSGN